MISDFEAYPVCLHEDLGQFSAYRKIDVLGDIADLGNQSQRRLRHHNCDYVTGCVKYRAATVSSLDGSGDLQQCVVVAGPGNGVDLAECRLRFCR